jgi:hypothetical protein
MKINAMKAGSFQALSGYMWGLNAFEGLKISFYRKYFKTIFSKLVISR